MAPKKSGKNVGNTNAAKEKTMPSHDDMALKTRNKANVALPARAADYLTARLDPAANRQRGGMFRTVRARGCEQQEQKREYPKNCSGPRLGHRPKDASRVSQTAGGTAHQLRHDAALIPCMTKLNEVFA
jgi:hypothetical protein